MQIATHGILAASASAAASFSNVKSLVFDGVDDYVDCGDSNDLSFGDGSNDSAFSISAWVKMNDATRFRIANKGINFSNNYEYLFSTGGSDTISLNLYDSSTGGRIARKYNTALTSYEGTWIHILATYDGSSTSGGIKIYLNASRIDNASNNSGSYTAMENSTNDLEIGASTADSRYSNGHIDEVAVFNSELSASNVTSIYNSGSPADLTSLSPVSWWRNGDGDTYPTLNDNGSGSNNGTMTNMTSGDIVTDVP